MTDSRFCIGIDNISPGVSTAPGAPGGMRGYLLELLARLPQVSPHVVLRVLTPDWNADFSPLHERVEVVRLAGVPRSRTLRVWHQQTTLPGAIRRANVDVFFALATVAPLRVHVPIVLAVQFLQFYDFQESYGRARAAYLKVAVPASVRRATRVIVFTEFQREELRAHISSDPAKIDVVPHGVNHATFATPASDAALAEVRALSGERPFILYVSATYRYKNHRGLIDAFALLKRRHGFPHALVLAGAEEALSLRELREYAARAGVGPDTVVVGRMPNVAAAYQAADLFAFPSLYETFGLSVLEAMAAGCPLVASDRGAMAELGRGAAVLADPENPEAFAAAMAQILNDPTCRADLIARGRARAAGFTWARTAEQTYASLAKAAGRL